MLGNQLIHLEYVGKKSVSGHILRHIVCKNDCPEDELIKESTWTNSLGDVEIVWRQPHYHCDGTLAYSTGAHPKQWGHESMHLGILRVCGQFYSGASYALWTTNTFSFNDAARTFNHFMKGRTSHQKGMLRRLRFQMDWVWSEDGPWNRALDMTLIKSLTGVRSLRLQINHSVEAFTHYQAKMRGNEIALFKPEHLELVHRMAMLPLLNVEVFVGDRSPPFNLDALWTAEDRKEYAEAIRKMLLDPNGAARYAKGLEDWDAYKECVGEQEVC